jgi:hypothetical protein
MKAMRAAMTSCVTSCVALCMTSCFLQVTSGVLRELPAKAQPTTALLLRPAEDVVAAWDGSILQDGHLLVLLTDQRVISKEGDAIASCALVDVDAIVVNEDEGVVDVVTVGRQHVLLPLRSLGERAAFAKLVEAEVRRAKREASSTSTSTSSPPPAPPAPTAPSDATRGED